MVDQRVLDLTEITDPQANDLLILERAAGGTGSVNPNNLVPGIGRFNLVDELSVSIDNDRIRFLDASDGRPREILFRDVIFGNYRNNNEQANFTLTPARAIQAIEITTVAVTTITLDGNEANIGGADFLICNFTANNVTLASQNITMFVDGVSAPNATIRSRRTAALTVNNSSTQAIFSGG